MAGVEKIALERDQMIQPVPLIMRPGGILQRIRPDVREAEEERARDDIERDRLRAKNKVARMDDEERPREHPKDDRAEDDDRIEVHERKIVQKNVAHRRGIHGHARRKSPQYDLHDDAQRKQEYAEPQRSLPRGRPKSFVFFEDREHWYSITGMAVIALGFQSTVQWVLQHGYPLLFIVMLIEGPVVTAAGAFVAALHYMNVWIVLLLSVLANLIPDLVYYAVGYWGRETFINKFGHYIGVTPERIAATEKLAEQHSGKSIFMIKMIPLLATPGLILVGATRMDVKKYAFWSLVITVPTSLFYLIIGYYFGAAYNTIQHYLDLGIYVALAAIVIVIAIAYLQRKYFAGLKKKIGME